MSSRSFNSKILLFGEYSVIQNSMALAMPYSLFSGKLVFSSSENSDRKVDSELLEIVKFLKNLNNKGKLLCNFDVTSFEFDVSQGLKFNSTIPLGHGIGSSGALCAALFDRYSDWDDESLKDITSNQIIELKKILAQMESHFHGKSSGVDPLISYLDRPLLIEKDGKISITNLPDYKSQKSIFLLNTGRSRRTEPLVNLFLEKCKITEFNEKCKNELLPITNDCIVNFLEGNKESLFEQFAKLSEFQLNYFDPMIPKLYREIWREGLASDQYYLKLCGAGGGGFLMGMAKDFKTVSNLLSNYQIRALV